MKTLPHQYFVQGVRAFELQKPLKELPKEQARPKSTGNRAL